MPTISANVSKKELDAIREYANACGETMSNLIRKCLISDAIFRNYYGDGGNYGYGIEIPDGFDGNEEDQFLLDSINKIRKILGLSQKNEV